MDAEAQSRAQTAQIAGLISEAVLQAQIGLGVIKPLDKPGQFKPAAVVNQGRKDFKERLSVAKDLLQTAQEILPEPITPPTDQTDASKVVPFKKKAVA